MYRHDNLRHHQIKSEEGCKTSQFQKLFTKITTNFAKKEYVHIIHIRQYFIYDVSFYV